jgi:catalase
MMGSTKYFVLLPLLFLISFSSRFATAQQFTDAKSLGLEMNFTVDDSLPGDLMTTNWGTRIDNDDNSLKAGPDGPVLMEDFFFRDKITHFDHERIPERVVHARGSGAHGYFQMYESLSNITMADFLTNTSKRTPVFVRFSTVLGFRGSPDTVRDVRGFATKFYTDVGNFDIVGNNIPVFFIQDAIKFPDIIHAGKPEPFNEIPQASTAHDNLYDFVSLAPETLHMIMWTLSDRAIPRSFRMMQGFGVHSFVLVNATGARTFVKFHWMPMLGVHSLVWDEAHELAGIDPDFHRRDLFAAIEAGQFPEFELFIQVVAEADANNFTFDILDSTKLIPTNLVPLQRVGKMVLNRNPDNFFSETEQVAFCTHHMVPGIEPSNDPLMQGRLFSYLDTQMIRLGGPNFQEIPINAPVCPVLNNQRDGYHRILINKARVNYFPNRLGAPTPATTAQGGYTFSAENIVGARVRARGPKFNEFYAQARLFVNSLATWERQHLIQAAIFELGNVQDLGVKQRMIQQLSHIDFEMAVEVSVGIGAGTPNISLALTFNTTSPELSEDNNNTLLNNNASTIVSRHIAFLLGPGFNSNQLFSLNTSLTAFGAVVVTVGTSKNLTSNTGTMIQPQWTFLTAKSVQFDAVVIVGGNESVANLTQVGEAKLFVNQAFKHYKPIAAINEGVNFLAGLNLTGIQLAGTTGVVSSLGVVTTRSFAAVDATIHNTTTTISNPSFGDALFQAVAFHRFYNRTVTAIVA